MSKFGELVDLEIPVLLNFYTEWDDECKLMHPILRDVAAALGDEAKVIKIDIDKNQQLAEALRVKTLPTFIVYKNGEMVWRKSGVMDANSLVVKVKETNKNS
ncbi:MAG: thioredoxin family protein [Bacteroidota bacterium]